MKGSSTRSVRSAPARLDPAALAGLARVRADPASFIREWLGADLWAKQVEIAEAVRDYRRVAVKSCHASGKSYLCARIVLWFLHAYPDAIVITTAPTYNQVVNILWREIAVASAGSRSPLLGRCLGNRYEIGPGWYAIGFKASDGAPDRFQGFHAEHALVVIDEAAGVAETVFEALDSVMTSETAHLLLPGNPTNASGTFYNAFHADRALYHPITIAAEDTPNLQAGRTVRPYLITQQWINDAIAKHGEDSDYVRCRVRAEFPNADSNALIPLAWIEAADARRAAEPRGRLEAGLDVSRGGGDETSLCIRRGIQVLAHHSWGGSDTRDLMETVGKVRHLLLPYPDLAALKVDVVGIGAGVHDRLAEEGYPTVAVNAGAKSADPGKWQNLRCELYWTMRELFQEGAIAGPLDDLAMGQGASIRRKYVSRFTMPVIESKEEAKSRGVQSPDRFEALLLAFTNPPPAAAGVWLL